MSQISRLRDAEITNGNLINADDIDAELDQLVSESNGQDTRLSSLESSAMTIDGVKTFSSAPKLDQINERTVDGGVTIDAVLLKDGTIRVPGSAGYTPATNGDLGYDSTAHAYKLMVNGTARTLTHSGDMGVAKGYIMGPAPVYASASSITLKAGLRCRNHDNTVDIEVASDITLSLSSSGAGGLDIGSEASGTWYFVYLIKKSSDGTVSAVFSTTNEAASGSITLPSGYDLKRQLPIAVRNDGSSNILPFKVLGGWPYRPFIAYTEFDRTSSGYQVLSSGTAVSWTTVNASTLVPAISQAADVMVITTSSTAYVGSIRPGGGSGNAFSVMNNTGTNENVGVIPSLPLNSSQQLQYILSNNIATHIAIPGFYVTEVD